MDQKEIEQVVKAVLAGIASAPVATASVPKKPDTQVYSTGVFASLDDAVSAARTAQCGLKTVSMRKIAVEAIRHAAEKHAQSLAEMAVQETGMGRVEDKFVSTINGKTKPTSRLLAGPSIFS